MRTAEDSFPWEAPAWKLMFAFCGQCWERRRLWAKGNVGYCKVCRPEWGPGAQTGGKACE